MAECYQTLSEVLTLAVRYLKVDVLVFLESDALTIQKEQIMPEGIGYGGQVAGGSANTSAQRTNSSERSEGAREASRTREESGARQEARAQGGVVVQISERGRAGAEAPREQSDTYEDPRARRRG